MKVTHLIKNLSIRKTINGNLGFLITNKKGSYCSFFNNSFSRYQGLFFFDSKSMSMYKFIDDIYIVDDAIATSLTNGCYYIQREKGNVEESFAMPAGFNSLIYELSKEREIDLLLDCKNSYDNREWGRHYDIFAEEGCIIVKFTKRTDRKEDFSDGLEEFVLYLAIKSDGIGYKKNDRWVLRNYPCDEERKSLPFKRYVYNALRLNGGKFVFSMGKNKNDAIKECQKLFKNIRQIKSMEKKYFYDFLKNDAIKNILNNRRVSNKIKIAYANALNSLNSLIVNDESHPRIFAGLPWFFQFWSRDTLISLKAASKINCKNSEKIILNYLKNIKNYGRLPNLAGRHGSIALENADAHGWLFFRCWEFIESLHKNIYEIEASLEKSIYKLSKFHAKNGFEHNEPKETWMDTDFGNDKREGARIEIQALRLNMYKLMFELTQNQKYKIIENTSKNKVKEEFWNGKLLADGLGDFTIRPNIFIAAYIYPDLLGRNEWESCFENALQSIWLEWGGLSTIDKNNKLFTDAHTGEDTRSYHRGDSWFWINNLAALTLSRINNRRFKKQIQKIIDASTEEILWKGCIGCHSELSSAKELSSKGCFNQAWSNAIYIELIDEIFSS
ncbi:hypothetical protein HYY70_07260 [Candidatus Woesearchaeota archaeon]|nr:hypothetical protein [Candidatus Woesearchaeota archaeon]